MKPANLRKLRAALQAIMTVVDDELSAGAAPVKKAPVRLSLAPEPSGNPVAARLAARALARKRTG